MVVYMSSDNEVSKFKYIHSSHLHIKLWNTMAGMVHMNLFECRKRPTHFVESQSFILLLNLPKKFSVPVILINWHCRNWSQTEIIFGTNVLCLKQKLSIGKAPICLFLFWFMEFHMMQASIIRTAMANSSWSSLSTYSATWNRYFVWCWPKYGIADSFRLSIGGYSFGNILTN